MAAVKSNSISNVKLKAGKKKSINKWLVAAGVAAVAIVGVVAVFTSHAGTCTSISVKYGDKGVCVSRVQGMVNGNLLYGNTSKYLTVDGVYGPKTRDYVKLFQASRGLTTTGNVGPNTWYQLCNLNMGGTGGTTPAWMQQFQKYARAAGCSGY